MAVITSAASGLASAGSTWTGGVVPVAGDRVTIAAGHTVTLDGTFHWGEDSASGVTVIGTLKASRTVSSMLTVRGRFNAAGTGFRTATIDFGTPADPIPAGITATLRLNESPTMAANKWHGNFNASAATYFCGAGKTSWTRLSGAVAAGATTAVVDSATNWAVGDAIGFVGTDNITVASMHRATITAIAGNTITFAPAMTVAKGIRGPVANFTRNVVVKSFDPAYPGRIFADMNTNSGGDGPFGSEGMMKFYHMVFEDLGSGAGGSVAIEFNGRDYYRGASSAVEFDGAVICSTVGSSAFGRLVLGVNAGVFNPYTIRNTVVWLNTTSGQYVWNSNSGAPHFIDSLLVSPSSTIFFDAPARLTRCYVSANNTEERGGVQVGAFFEDVEFAMVGIVRYETLNTIYRRCSFGVGDGVPPIMSSALALGARMGTFSGVVLEDCKFPAASGAPGSIETVIATREPVLTSDEMTIKVHRPGGDPTKYIWRRKYGAMHRDASVRRAGDASIRHTLLWSLSGKPAYYEFPVASRSGVATTVVVYVRKNSAYGSANLPKLTLSGLGSAPTSFTMPDVADTWIKVTLTTTQNSGSPGDLTLRWEGFHNGDASSAMWLDGLYFEPFVSAARHFGYVFDEKVAARETDPSITMSEEAALLLPVSVDHVAATITVSGAATSAEVYQACIADLCKTENLGQDKHITFEGGAFVTTYTVVNPQNISGAFTDATGAQVFISAPALIAGSRVQLFSVTRGVQIANEVLGAAGYSTRVSFSGSEVIRLRAEHATKLPLEAVGILSESGITFLDVQVEDTIYLAFGIDGASVTEFAADGPNIQIDINDADGVTSVQRLYAWMQHYQTTEVGIASPFFGAMVATDAANFVVDQALVDLKLDNVSGLPLRVVGGYLSRKDGSTVIAATSGSVQMDPGKAYAVTVTGSGSGTGTGTVDNAAIAAAVWANATRTLTTSSAPTAAEVATAVRTELTTELARVDANVSSRLATAGYTAPTAAPTAAEVATAVRTELAPELARVDASVSSRLPTATYVAPTASPTAAQVASAVRVELATELGRIDTSVSSRLATVSYVAPYTLTAVATAVRTELATELGRIDVATSSRLAAISYAAPTAAPSAASVASAVRAELSTELGRIDATVSSRLAAVSYVAPSAPDTAAISSAVWSAATRTLTVASGMTAAQELKIDQTKLLVEQVQTKVDATL